MKIYLIIIAIVAVLVLIYWLISNDAMEKIMDEEALKRASKLRYPNSKDNPNRCRVILTDKDEKFN